MLRYNTVEVENSLDRNPFFKCILFELSVYQGFVNEINYTS